MKAKTSKIATAILIVLAVVGIVAGYKVFVAGAATVDVLGGNGDFEGSQYDAWTLCNVQNTVYGTTTATKSTTLQSVYQRVEGSGVRGIGYLKYRFVMPAAEKLDSSILSLDYQLTLYPTGFAVTNWKIYWEIWNDEHTEKIAGGTIFDNTGKTNSVPWTHYTSPSINGLKLNTAYNLYLYNDSTTISGMSVDKNTTYWDNVQLNVTTSVDSTPPSTTLISPPDGSTQTGTVDLRATATDDTAVDRVYFDYAAKADFSDAAALAAVFDSGTGQWVTSWDTSGKNGTYYVRSRAYDLKGQEGISPYFTYALDNQGPTFNLTYYSDESLTTPLLNSSGIPLTGKGDVYIKATPSETLRTNAGDNQITIDAPGTLNDVANADLTWTGSAWIYKWTVQKDVDGFASVLVKGTDQYGNITPSSPPNSGGTVKIVTTGPSFALEYYRDAALSRPLAASAGLPATRAGIVYVKLVPSDALRDRLGDNQITIDAPGTVNDIYRANFSWNGSSWVFPWTVSLGNSGNTSSITVKATDVLGNVSTGTPTAGGTVMIDNNPPVLSLSYYSDSSLAADKVLPVSNGKPITKAGHVWIKLISDKALSELPGDNTITIDAPGSDNDVAAAAFTKSGTNWVFDWTVQDSTDGKHTNDGDTNSITVKGTDYLGNTYTGIPASGGGVTIDNTPPSLSLRYFTDSELTTPAAESGGHPQARLGLTYIKLVSSEGLAEIPSPTITIDAPGTVNDRSNVSFTWDAPHSAWVYQWNVQEGNDGEAAVASVSGSNTLGLTFTGPPASGGQIIVQTESKPAALSMTGSKLYVTADNEAISSLTAHLTNQYDASLAGWQINFVTNVGTFADGSTRTSVITDSDGNAVVRVKSADAGTARITGTVNGLSEVTAGFVVVFGAADNVPPELLKAEATSKQVIYLTFNEPLKSLAGSTFTITQDDTTVSSFAYLTQDTRVVRLVLLDGFSLGTGNQYPNSSTYTVTAAGVTDQADNVLAMASVNFEAFTPHGKYAANPVPAGGSTKMCGQCHIAHNSPGKNLLNRMTISKVCFVCHGNTGISSYLVEGEFTSRYGPGSTFSQSLHKSLDLDTGYGVLYCTDCHNPHGDKVPGQGNAVYPKLLRSTVNGSVYYKGNDFCFACHGSTDWAFSGDESYYAALGGDHTNANAVHYSKDIQNGALSPVSGSEITCVRCHEKHGAQYTRLLDNNRSNGEEDQCYKCHGKENSGKDMNYSMSGVNIYDIFQNSVSKHRVGDTDYGRIECSSCHGPHSVGNAKFSAGLAYSAISDPGNTKISFVKSETQTMSDFCLKCHDSTAPTAGITATSVVPYTISFVDQGFTTNGGGWNKNAPYSYRDSGHYTNTDLKAAADDYGNSKNECTICHDWHGTDYKWLVRLDEDKYDSPGICLQCHNSDSFAPNGDNIKSINVYQDLANTSAHPTIKSGYSGRHSNTEDYFRSAEATADVRHAQCYDCHDPHTANGGSGPIDKLGNVSAVRFSWGNAAWGDWDNSTPSAVSVLLDPKTNNVQAYLCFKCHSKAAYHLDDWNGDLRAPFDNPSASKVTFKQTDVAREFNPNNRSKHIVIPDYPDTSSEINIAAGFGNFTGSWSKAEGAPQDGLSLNRNSVLKCTDCHASASGAQGPHGSTNAFILQAPWIPSSSMGTKTGTPGTQDHLCFKCHHYEVYVGGDTEGLTETASQFQRGGGPNEHLHENAHQGAGCASCHGGLPHGWWRTNAAGHGLPLNTNTDIAPYKIGSTITAISDTITDGGADGYTGAHVDNCSTVCTE